MDVEFSKWGIESGPNAQFVVQPYYNPGNREQFSISLPNDASTHIIQWMKDLVFFQSPQGKRLDPQDEDVIHEWDYTGEDIPTEGNEQVHINLWLLNGQAPSDGKTAEMVIKSFTFATSKCPNCSGTSVTLENETFVSGSECRCIGTQSITIGPGVTVKSGAKLFIKFPYVKLLAGFTAKHDATLTINGKNSVP